MKKSEQIRQLAGEEDNDIKRFGLDCKARREARSERFVDKELQELLTKFKITHDPAQGRYTISTKKHGRVMFYPRANKLLICKENRWIWPGLRWIINFLLKDGSTSRK